MFPTARILLTAALVSLAGKARLPAAEKEPSPRPFELKTAPMVQHLGPQRVVVSWESHAAEASTVEFWTDSSPPSSVEEKAPDTEHSVVLAGLRPQCDYEFRIRIGDPGGTQRATRTYRFDSSCDLASHGLAGDRPRFPADTHNAPIAAAAAGIVESSGVDRGYCLVLGCHRGLLAVELARRTRLQVIVVEPDAEKVDALRRVLDSSGLYGTRVAVHHGPLEKLPYADHFANLIVSERTLVTGEIATPIAEVCRVLRPCGGVARLGRPAGGRLTRPDLEAWIHNSPLDGWKIEDGGGLWAEIRRGRLPGAGQWTHLYADAGNSACGGDRLCGPVDVQWFGRPGPRQMVDRHHRGMAPLAVAGRLFVAGSDRLKAVDAYNGTPLWDLTIPGSRRVCVHRDCGHVVATEDRVYVAVEDTCRSIDSATGRCTGTYRIPWADGDPPLHWGYLGCLGDRLIGTAEIAGASYTAHNRFTVERISHWDNVPMVTSLRLFCLDRRTGSRHWSYNGGGAILNSAIAAGDGRIYFIQSGNPAALADPDGRVALSVALTGGTSRLVALDQDSGRVAWQQAVDLSALRHAVYLSYARGTVLITGSFNQGKHPRYDLLAFDAVAGRPKWASHYLRTDKPAGGDHGEQDQHPALVGGVVYSRPAAFDLETGRRLDFNLDRAGHGCGTLSASAAYLFGRGGNPQMYPIEAGGRSSVALTTVTRPGCWINIIPAAGMLLIPESSSGCSCPFSVQTSLTLTPRCGHD